MFKNYIKIAVNHIINHKLYALINILGLSIGLTCSILIGLYVLDEMSFDRFFQESDRIYRVSKDSFSNDFYPASTNAPFAPQLKADFPQLIEESTRLYNFLPPVVMDDNTPFQENGFLYADPSFLTMFSFNWLQGEPETALNEPMSIVLTEAVAGQYFGNVNPMGETLTLAYGERQVDVTVRGIIGNLPGNTHFVFRALVSMSTATSIFGDDLLSDWRGNTDFHTYIKLQPGADIADLEMQVPAFLERHVAENASELNGLTFMKLADIHLYSTRIEELKPTGSLSNVIAFALIAIGIVLIACVNFMNLSTARSSMRSKEVGMRKTIGAEKNQLVQQFLGESLVLTTLAMGIALVLVEVLLPWFEAFTGKTLSFTWFQDPPMVLGVLGVIILVGLIAGSYPAFFLSSFKPSEVMKGNQLGGRGDKLLRQSLVMFQFAISITLVVATAVIYAQMQYARSIDLGLEKDQVVVISGTRTRGLGDQWQTMKQELLSHPDITSATNSHYRPFTQDANFIPVFENRNANEEPRVLKYMAVDYDFFQTYGIDIIAGRAFSEERGTDRLFSRGNANGTNVGSFIINSALARSFGWTPEEAVGKFLWQSVENDVFAQVIGVTEESYFESIAVPVQPLVFFIGPPNFRGVPSQPQGAVRITGNNIQDTLAHIDNVWQQFLPDLPLDRHFLNDDFEALYLQEQKQGEMMTYFTVLAVFIACLGLYGLASFNAERRIKEIGVRKVMGSSVWGIVVLLTNDFSRLVLLSNIIAWPVAYFAMNRWLETFAYRIDLTPLIFIGSGLIALCIAWVTVGGTAAKAASQRPVLALRYE